MARVDSSRSACAALFLAILIPLPDRQGAVAPELRDVLRRIQTFYRSSPGIVAGFIQILESRTLPSRQEETGTLSLKAPGRMRWEYSRPRGKLAVTDGTKAYLYLPEDRAVLIGSVKDLDAGAVVARVLLGEASLESEFQVEGEPAPHDPETWVLRLVPKTAGFPYDSLTAEVSSESGALRRLQMLDPLGNRMEYRFEDIRVEKNLPDRLFIFRIPRGAEIQTFGGDREKAPSSP